MHLSSPHARFIGMALAISVLPSLEAQRPQPVAVASSRSVSAPLDPRLHIATIVAPHDTASDIRRRDVVLGAVVGAAVGGLAGAAIGVNQNATECVTSGLPVCPRKPDHTLLFTAGGLVVGAALGALLIHSFDAIGR